VHTIISSIRNAVAGTLSWLGIGKRSTDCDQCGAKAGQRCNDQYCYGSLGQPYN
jgi:hypothetical protein